MGKYFLLSWIRFCWYEIFYRNNAKIDTGIAKNQLPSESKATSELRGAQRPHLIGVGDSARWKGSLSYSLKISSGDSGWLYNGGTEVARASRGDTLYERGGILIAGGGTLRARNGLDR